MIFKVTFATMVLAASVAGYICPGRSQAENYQEVVQNVYDMVWDQKVTNMAGKHGLDVVNVTWEDTGRYSGSCWGPNISDMTIQVHSYQNGSEQPSLTCMPVIRYPNFHDISADMDPDNFYLLVGNEIGEDLAPVSLTDFVDNIRYYLHDPNSWEGDEHSLLAERDSVVLVSAQAVFLPIRSQGNATFNPVLYNYQSYEGDPAVLTILVTREGTSVTVIDNQRDAVPGSWSWGQRLFFNDDGQRASLTGQRISDFRHDYEQSGGDPSDISEESNLNMVLLIQIPLKQKNPQSTYFDVVCCDETASAPMGAAEMSRSSDVEAAVIGHGELEGPFTEIDGLEIERDPEFPIRVTVQFYKATSNGVATQEDIDDIAEEIQKVYDQGSYVGSLVVPDPGVYRPTDWNRASVPRRLNRYWSMVQQGYLNWIGRGDLLKQN
ncbi:MAG: hypothetical protein GF388_08765 [Candidatus Aegiribacteria sp.]|nr:hypothetical protein [Candidatus Aegiribacteria sp.]MBD3295168.1 hypothetical protein [Candidatus Fermentibacteria bacterium]